MVIHTVQPGESLYRIAQIHGVPLPLLLQQNELHEPDRLTPGQAIVVARPAQTCTVRQGDTLGILAARHGTTVCALWQNNPQLGGMERIVPGQSLTLSYGPRLGALTVNGCAGLQTDGRVLRKTLPYLTYLTVYAGGVDNTGRLRLPQAAHLTRLARQYGARPLLALTAAEGAGRPSGGQGQRLLRDAAVRHAWIDGLPQTLAAQGFAGVAVGAAGQPSGDAEAYTGFVRALRAALEPAGCIVLAALPAPSAGRWGRACSALGAAAEHVLLLPEDGERSRAEPGPAAPLDRTAQAVRRAAGLLPPGRLLLDVPSLGHDWTLSPLAGQARVRTIDCGQAVRQATQAGAAIRYDGAAQAPHYSYRSGRTAHEVWFEDARSVCARLALAGEHGLQGISIRNITPYFLPLWLVLNQLYEIKKYRTPPAQDAQR